MKLFIDTANLADIEEALRGGFVRGITTNPSLLAKEPKSNYLKHIGQIVEIANKYGGDYSLSIEVFTDDQKEMVEQAKKFVRTLNYKDLAIKIHISHKGQNNLNVIKELAQEGIAVNCTACMTPLQAMAAAASGAKFVSLFYNRIRDGGSDEKFKMEREGLLLQKNIESADFDPNQVIRETRNLLASYPQAEIISGSIRTPIDVKQAGLAGSHIVTTALKIIKSALGHFQTDEAVDRFFSDFASWSK